MANRKFTAEEMTILRESPYILKVTPSIVHFSVEFKKKFWEAILRGEAPCDIVYELGIDPDILGVMRVNGLKSMIQKEIKSGKGFRDINTYNEYLDGYITPQAQIKHLKQQLEYKEQEIEFLKKIVSLGKEEQG